MAEDRLNDFISSSIQKGIEEANQAFVLLEQTLREKILFGLSVFPYVSPSMLHVFLGTATPKSIWKDVVLEKLIQEGLVCKQEVTLTSPYDRTQTYTILRLTDNAYTPPVQPGDNATESV